MESRILQLIAALRASGVRVSLAESAEAFSAVDLMGIQNREHFRLSLRATLIKDLRDLPVAAALGVFLPCYLFVIIPAPYFRRFAKNPQVKAFVDGVTSAATGAGRPAGGLPVHRPGVAVPQHGARGL